MSPLQEPVTRYTRYMQFQVGDRVTLINLKGWCGPQELQVGDEGVVTGIGTNPVPSLGSSGSTEGDGHYCQSLVISFDRFGHARRLGVSAYRLQLSLVLERLAREI